MEPDFAETLKWDTTAIEPDEEYYLQTKEVRPITRVVGYMLSFLRADPYFHSQLAAQIKARTPEASIRVYQQHFLQLDINVRIYAVFKRVCLHLKIESNRVCASLQKYARYFDIVALINGPFYYLTAPEERAAALKRFKKILKPGGVLLLDMANFMYLLHNLGPVGGSLLSLSMCVYAMRDQETDFSVRFSLLLRPQSDDKRSELMDTK
jgi:SAM-dependent methyltransferase